MTFEEFSQFVNSLSQFIEDGTIRSIEGIKWKAGHSPTIKFTPVIPVKLTPVKLTPDDIKEE